MPMSSDMKKCIIFNAIASGLGWAGFGVGISAITSNFWIRDSSSIRIGLWNQCDVNNLCSPLQTVEPWLNAVRAFMILFIIFMMLGSIANIASQCKISKDLRSSSGGIFSIGATFGMVAASIYTSFINQQYAAGSFVYGYGFGAAWGLVGGGYLAGLFNQLSARYMPDSNEGTCNNKNEKEEKF